MTWINTRITSKSYEKYYKINIKKNNCEITDSAHKFLLGAHAYSPILSQWISNILSKASDKMCIEENSGILLDHLLRVPFKTASLKHHILGLLRKFTLINVILAKVSKCFFMEKIRKFIPEFIPVTSLSLQQWFGDLKVGCRTW